MPHLKKTVKVLYSEPMEEQHGVFHRVNHVDSGVDSDKHVHVHKENDYDTERLLSEIQKGSLHGTPYFSTFSADPTPNKNEVSYLQQAFEIQSVKHQYPKCVLKEGNNVITKEADLV